MGEKTLEQRQVETVKSPGTRHLAEGLKLLLRVEISPCCRNLRRLSNQGEKREPRGDREIVGGGRRKEIITLLNDALDEEPQPHIIAQGEEKGEERSVRLLSGAPGRTEKKALATGPS